jgi:hypothetical protein
MLRERHPLRFAVFEGPTLRTPNPGGIAKKLAITTQQDSR